MAATPREIRWTARRASTYLSLVKHRLGAMEGQTTRLDHLDTMRQASSLLEGLSWRWLEEFAVTVTVAANATHAPLPLDCGSVMRVVRDGFALDATYPTTGAGMSSLRAEGLPVELTRFHVARMRLSAESDRLEPALEVYPTPTQDVTLVVHYRRTFPRPENDDDLVLIPDWLEALYEFTVLEVAEGRERPETGNVAERWGVIVRSELMRTARARDGATMNTGQPLGLGDLGRAMAVRRAGRGFPAIGTYVVE